MTQPANNPSEPTPTDSPDAQFGELSQKVRQLESQLDHRSDELATAEAQRDETTSRLCETENRLLTERLLTQAGVVDVETASLLLGQRVDFSEPVANEDLTSALERLLLEKPYLRATAPAMPGPTRTGRDEPCNEPARLAQIADRAAKSGNRKDIAEYLRLRRQLSP